VENKTNIFLDINILIDIPDMERENHFYSREIFSLADAGLIIASCSILSFNIFFYVARKKLGNKAAIDYMATFLEIIKVVPADINLAMQAIIEPVGNDFEDSLQYYSAMQINNLDYIVTANTKDFKKGRISVITPLQFLKIYQSK
jgi:predicted nucleic acid-binding protein